MALVELADRLCAVVEKAAQDCSGVVWRSADKEILRRIAPALGKPFKVGLETTGRCDDFLRTQCLPVGKSDTVTIAILHAHLGNLCFI